MVGEFKCVLSQSTTLEAYIGRHEEDTVIEVAISNPLDGVASVCLRVDDARALAATLVDLADRLEKHLAKKH